MGELKRLRKVEKKLGQQIDRQNKAYERLLRKRDIMILAHSVEVTKLIAEVKLWRDKYVTLKELYDKIKKLYLKLKNRGK